MSYIRWGEQGSSVYVYNNGERFFCVDCLLDHGGASWMCRTPAKMAEHLRDHVTAGHTVPQCAFDRLTAEADPGEAQP